MKLAILTAYPPSKVTLNEYGYHLVKNFATQEEYSEIVVLHDELESGKQIDREDLPSKVRFRAAWKFDSLSNIWKVSRKLLQEKPDVVFFNLQFLQFGSSKLAAALGLALPWIAKLLGIRSVVLLHNIIETVDYQEAGITAWAWKARVFDTVGRFLSRILLRSDLVCLTMQSYVDIYRKKYKAENVALLPHGTFEIPEVADFEIDQEELSVLAFGKFGSYKKVENMIEAVADLRQKLQRKIKIVIAGSDNPNTLGYLASVQKRYAHLENLVFTGYVEEEEVPELFRSASLVVFPYTSTTGSSGVLHQASSYGKAAVLPNIGDLTRLIEEEGYTGSYFQTNDKKSLAEAIELLLVDDEKRRQIARQNYEAAATLPMSEVCHRYTEKFRQILHTQPKPNKTFTPTRTANA